MSSVSLSLNRLRPLANLASYHLLFYGTLLGTELYQSFVMTKVCYQALPMSAFTTLQKRVFPLYFRIQTLLIILTAVTYPPYGPASLISRVSDLIPITVAAAMAALNLGIYGPRTQKAMIERIHQETRDQTKYNDASISQEMKAKNRSFSKAHAMSIHLNLVAIGATIYYGFCLASRFELVGTV